MRTGASPASGHRVVGVDVARALASLIMVQGHAYHGWVAEPFRQSPSYLFTRLLGTLPLPAFLVLAGVGVGLRARAAVARAERAADVRASLVRRGLEILLAGYVTNVAFALLDGGRGLATLLRADVLHVIGLSIIVLAGVGVRADPTGHLRTRWLRGVAWAMFLAPTLLCRWLSPLGDLSPAWLRPVAALFVDVPNFTRMPAVPLLAWLAMGTLLGTSTSMLSLGLSGDFERRAGSRVPRVLGLALCALVLAWVASLATDVLVERGGEPLTRAHPAVVLNVIDLGARGALVLALGLLLGGALPDRAGRRVAELGQASLWIYVAHLPFCYGRLAAPLSRSLDMLSATLWLVPLALGSIAVGLWRTRLRRGSKVRA